MCFFVPPFFFLTVRERILSTVPSPTVTLYSTRAGSANGHGDFEFVNDFLDIFW